MTPATGFAPSSITTRREDLSYGAAVYLETTRSGSHIYATSRASFSRVGTSAASARISSRYEDLLADPHAVLAAVFKYVGVDAGIEAISRIIHDAAKVLPHAQAAHQTSQSVEASSAGGNASCLPSTKWPAGRPSTRSWTRSAMSERLALS